MSDLSRLPTRGGSSDYPSSYSSSPAPPPPPPPAPPAPPLRYSNRAASALARFAQPFFSGSRPPSPQTSTGRADLSAPRASRSKSLPGASQTVTHKTGIPISALDISPERTHAVIGGKEILKILRVSSGSSSDEFNLRDAITNDSNPVGSGLSARHKDQLTVRDVKWSHGPYDRIIATAVANGRIVVYDLHRAGLEYCRFQGHSRQVHKLAFNPHRPAWLLSGSQDSSIRMWDLRAPSSERGVSTCGSREMYHGNSDAIRDIRWSPGNGVMFATATDSGTVQLWDCRKPAAPSMRITAHDRPCFSVDWHPDGRHIVSGGTDKQVKVWDFSESAERRQKPTFQFRTPQAVLNVRWRPPSRTKESQGSGDWQQTSQVVTSYDKEDPRVHLWDLRRPHIPYREFDRYDTYAADLLWHSKDLLWTVGDAGAFTQTDIRYAPQVVNQRPTCSVAWSPNGQVLSFGQSRPRPSPRRLSTTEFLGFREQSSSGEKLLGGSPPDDILGDATLPPPIRHRHSKSTGARPSKSLGSTPPSAPDQLQVVALDKVLAKDKAPGLQQLGAIGSIPGATMDPALFRYLARQYSPLMDDINDKHAHGDMLRSLLESLDRNAERAEDVLQLKLAQTWRIIKYAVIQELQLRAKEERESPDKATNSIKKKVSKEGPLGEKQRSLDDGKPDKMKKRLFKGVMETEGQRKALSDTESPSNMTTPLAQPLPDSPVGSYDSSDSQVTSLNDDLADIQPLPPSVLSNQGTMSSTDWSMSDVDVRPTGLRHRQSTSSEAVPIAPDSVPSDQVGGSMLSELQGDQRSAPRAITGRVDWRARAQSDSTKEESVEDEYDQKMEDKKAAIRDYKIFPKKPLSIESPIETKPSGFQRHGSSESFPMFSASTESSHPAKASFSPASKLYEASQIDERGDAQTDGNEARARASLLTSEPVQGGKELQGSNGFAESPPDSRVHLERPSSPPPLLTESYPLEAHAQVTNLQDTTQPAKIVIPGVTEDLSSVILPISPDLTESKPWSVEVMLKEAIKHYSSGSHVDIQSATHLLHTLHIIFQDCEKIISYEDCEMLFQKYNEQLLQQSMYTEAAELRLLCVPSYPAVYEYAQLDSFINVFCFTCKRPYENPKQDNTRCHRCSTPQDPCAICMSIDPPPEWVAEQSLPADQEVDSEATSHLLSSRSSIRTETIPESEIQRFDGQNPNSFVPPPKGSALWTWCQGCGHGGHMACISMWLRDVSISEGGCATPGCMHDCGPGPRREYNRTALHDESKKRDSTSRKAGMGFVKRDPWTKGESKAVEKVRGMLGVTSGGTTSVSTTTSSGPSTTSGIVSPKKVRLVTPSEQGKRRSSSTRTSLGGAVDG